MKHEDFRKAVIGEAFEMIEGSILPSLERLIDAAVSAEPGVDAAAKAAEIRALAEQLESLAAIYGADFPAAE